MAAFFDDILIIGGGPSILLHESGWLIPRMAVNSHAHRAGIKTDYYVGCDPIGYHDEGVLNDASIEKWFPAVTPRMKEMGHLPNVHFNALYRAFDSIVKGEEMDEHYGQAIVVSFKTMLVAIRLAWIFGYRNMFFIGCDMKDDMYASIRERLEEIATPLFNHRNIVLWDIDQTCGVPGMAPISLDMMNARCRPNPVREILQRRPPAESKIQGVIGSDGRQVDVIEVGAPQCKSSDSSTPKPTQAASTEST